MKNSVILLMQLLFILPALAQVEAENEGNPINTTRQGFGTYQGINMTVGFVNPKSRTEGSAYYFEDWNSEALVYLKTQGRYKIQTVNINLYDSTLEALYDENSVFTFDTENLVRIVINNKIFRIFTVDDKPKIFELVFNNKVSVYKYYSVSYTKSSANPMVNRRTNKYIKSENYYLYRDNELTKFKLTKKAFAKHFKSDNHSIDSIVDYINNNNLSLKKEEDLIQVLNFVSN